jgi:hypothetical protein
VSQKTVESGTGDEQRERLTTVPTGSVHTTVRLIIPIPQPLVATQSLDAAIFHAYTRDGHGLRLQALDVGGINSPAAVHTLLLAAEMPTMHCGGLRVVVPRVSSLPSSQGWEQGLHVDVTTQYADEQAGCCKVGKVPV